MKELDAYDYRLPKELIAQYPLPRRQDARLMLVDRASGELGHYHVRDLPELLRPADCLVLNDTRVIAARLVGRRILTGGQWEGLFLAADDAGNWRLLCRSRGKLQPGERIALADNRARDSLQLRLILQEPGGIWVCRPQSEQSASEILEQVGRVPLPPYIRQGEMEEADRARYQTVYARRPGSVAAPTAGLHFTGELLTLIEAAGVDIARVTLHVGLDTFRPISASSLDLHPMHSENGEIGEAAVETIERCRTAGGRTVAVGTTSVRVLETAAAEGGLHAWHGPTSLFIRPPYQFRLVDALLTNFHLPRTTLLVLVRTFGGDELIRRAYEEAIRERYRFYSYGDAMLIV